MRKATTHDQALRAALQVARGNRRQTAAAVTGLVMLGGCGDSVDTANTGTDEPDTAVTAGDTNTTGDAGALVDALDMAAEDALEAEVQTIGDTSTAPAADVTTDASATETPDVESVDAAGPADAMTTEDATAMHDGMTASDDASAMDAEAEGDAVSEVDGADVIECINGCWEPNGTTCTEHMDCAVPEDIIGACAGSGDPCVYVWECVEGEVCEGGKAAITPNLDPETGELYQFSSGVACFDGMCHEGDQISAAAQACCSVGGEEALPWCDDLQAPPGGCTPWGPPAPPAYDGTTLAQRMQRWLS
jgi:hypothetical protein